MLNKLRDKVLAGKLISEQEALGLANLNPTKTRDLLAAADRIKNELQGSEVDLCSIINAKSGNCSEDCKFCAQSIHYDTEVDNYPLLESEKIVARAKKMEQKGAQHFGLVTSGRGVIDDQEFEQIVEIIAEIKTVTDLDVCASLGTLDQTRAQVLSAVGLTRYNHNLETSKSYFSQICTTHNYQERTKTIKLLKKEDIEVCCGGIIGLGESFADRIELAFTLRELEVDSVPLNILNPVPGTPLEDKSPLKPMEALKTAAIFRFILPKKVIKLCGGRESNLRDLQSLALLSGINGLLTGNYLTTSGRRVEEDLQMINDLGLEGG